MKVLVEENAGVRKVILNRPKKLNSLTYEMIVEMLKKFKVYENDPMVKLVILKGNGRAFSAGGDVLAVYNFTTAGHWSFAASFYRKQLTLDYLLATYKKPLVSILNGIVMGGGAGLSMHSRFRIVTENTLFAMPEASIGLFPDVGASHFLSRLPGFFGEYLGLTGARLVGTEMLACGLATHFILAKDLVSLENALRVVGSLDVSDISTISDIIVRFVHKVHIKQDSAYSRLDIINECFSRETVEEILLSLENFSANREEKWIIKAINYMKSASPTSLKLSLRSIRKGRIQKLEQCLIHEFNVFCHILRRTVNDDFFEGSRSMLVDKNKNPQWQPSKLELVTEEMLTKCFDKVDDDDWESLQLPAKSNQSFILESKL
ncbi:probable 3-hydroxyisobutyryl-CoA hydrolase 3 [Cornus florida]|uniref:probable 3-hydroxyisobutyryl-CoA hydrolase 3 n=1 Tax=Cornus florida TaxID=4283 RepID=UPI00289D5074|nr:probable 3-hydroxyisobutyryl-CoA hydrolase 3 [Cornus florida]